MKNLLRGLVLGLALGVAALISGPPAAQASVLTFDDYTPLYVQPLSTFDYGGLTFSFSLPVASAVWDGGSPNSNGTNNVIFGYDSVLTITRTGGGVFDLLGLDSR